MEPSTHLQSFKADFFKALAHPIRIRILELLRSRDRSVQELQALLDLAASGRLGDDARAQRRPELAKH